MVYGSSLMPYIAPLKLMLCVVRVFCLIVATKAVTERCATKALLRGVPLVRGRDCWLIVATKAVTKAVTERLPQTHAHLCIRDMV